MIDEDACIDDIESTALLVSLKGKTYQVLLKDEYAKVLLNLAQTYSEKGTLKLLELDSVCFEIMDKDELDKHQG